MMQEQGTESQQARDDEVIPGIWTPVKGLKTIGHPAIYRMILLIYIPVLIPLTLGMGYFGRWIDGLLGWGRWPAWPLNFTLFLVLLLLGLSIVWWCYTYIVVVGGGGPAPLVAPPATNLLVEGPYRVVRHPSIYGKFLGALSVGFIMQTPSFMIFVLPLMLAGSLLEKKFFMEKRELQYWGERYQRYQQQVPFFIPRLSVLLQEIRAAAIRSSK